MRWYISFYQCVQHTENPSSKLLPVTIADHSQESESLFCVMLSFKTPNIMILPDRFCRNNAYRIFSVISGFEVIWVLYVKFLVYFNETCLFFFLSLYLLPYEDSPDCVMHFLPNAQAWAWGAPLLHKPVFKSPGMMSDLLLVQSLPHSDTSCSTIFK